ncbi:hypothetical protein DFA_02062 [Cavenderia fasciculata]|uniref:Uncharacterized protein n=1 Tax=Cavenderia fasciculata TaxID=261658 RepID=F4PYK9_CACFS|nr:uncharacterized protein DFA_02062 [Cavenderia fasciculata]EGG19275.1 hypothetical protein DFA_02062 [Cavenderia fasciculata]|eukprot:XP_004357546.1 hypothetical protein DFA_02062 [Cavenderia fasciculata]
MAGCGYWDMVDSMTEEFDAQEVLPKLFIGSAAAAQSVTSLKDHNISHVLSISTNPPVYTRNEAFQCLSISIEDEEKRDISTFFDQCHQFIDSGRTKGGILIHCTAGVSRSATVVISYLMNLFFKPFMYCFQFLKSIRPCVQPNKGFVSQLLSYEGLLFSNQQQLVQTLSNQLLSNNNNNKSPSCCSKLQHQQQQQLEHQSKQEQQPQPTVMSCQQHEQIKPVDAAQAQAQSISSSTTVPSC